MHSQILTTDNTLGAAYIGVVVAALLLGVSYLQAWHYFTHQNDAWPIKTLVSAVMIFETVHQALISHCVYTYLVTDFGNHTALQYPVLSGYAQVIFNGLTALLVQSFLTVRVWRLSNGNVWLVGLILMLVVGEFCSIVAYTCMSFRLRTFTELAHIQALSITVNALAVGGDVLIAAALCTILHRSRTSFYRSNTIINKLILYTVNTGCLTSLCAVASLLSIIAAGQTFIYIAFYFCIGRLYSNSLLASLNARGTIRSGTANSAQNDNGVIHEISTVATTRSRTRSFPTFGRPHSPIVFSHGLAEFVTSSDSSQGLKTAEVKRRSSVSSTVQGKSPLK